MRSISARALSGPNVFRAGKPVIVASIDFGDYRHRLLRDVPALCERVLWLLPDMRPKVGRPVPETFLLVLRAILREMSFTPTLAAVEENRGSHTIAVDFVSEHATLFLFREIFAFFRDAHLPVRLGRQSLVERAKAIERDTDLGSSTRAILAEASKRSIPWFRLDDGSLMQLGYGSRRKLLNGTESQHTASVAVDIASNKDLTKSLLSAALVPVPRGGVATTVDEAVALFRSIGAPVAMKPVTGHHGDHVFPKLVTEEEVRASFRECSSTSKPVVVEESFRGKDYRIVVVGGRVVAACERRPASVVGDGIRAIYELIDNENRSPLRGDDYDRPLCFIEVDAELLTCLSHAGWTLASVPAPGEVVVLRQAANVSKGGTTVDVTDLLHPQTASTCVRAVRALELDIAGIDLVAPDISRALGNGAGIIEINAAPGISMHHCPDVGEPRNVGRAIVELLFPEGNGRIPIACVTGANGKTTVTRMIAHVLCGAGASVGVSCTDGIFVRDERIAPADPEMARYVLSDPRVDVAILELSEHEIVEHGLPYDRSDVAVVTNWDTDPNQRSHLELSELRVAARSLVAERVRDGGRLVVNAEDSTAMALLSRPRVRAWRKEIALCALAAHRLEDCMELELGGCAYLPEDGSIVEAMGGAMREMVSLPCVPATLGGRATFQIVNVMLAIAACRGLGLGGEEIARHLATFGKEREEDGRMSLYRVKSGHVLLDRGGNALAFGALGELLDGSEFTRRTCVVGAGSRGAEQEAGAIARAFHKVIVHGGARSDDLARAISRRRHDCRIIADESAALGAALREMMEGEVIIHYFGDLGTAKEVLREFGAERTDLLVPTPYLSGLRIMNADLSVSPERQRNR